MFDCELVYPEVHINYLSLQGIEASGTSTSIKQVAIDSAAAGFANVDCVGGKRCYPQLLPFNMNRRTNLASRCKFPTCHLNLSRRNSRSNTALHGEAVKTLKRYGMGKAHVQKRCHMW